MTAAIFHLCINRFAASGEVQVLQRCCGLHQASQGAATPSLLVLGSCGQEDL